MADNNGTLTVRASRMPLALICPGSTRGGLGIDPYHPASVMGTCAHVVYKAIADGNLDDLPEDFDEICASYNCDPDEMRPMMYMVLRWWVGIRGDYPDSVGEQHLTAQVSDGFLISCHPDRWALIQPTKPNGTATIRVCDVKSGFLDSDAGDQIRAGWCTVWAHVRSTGLLKTDNVRFEADLCRPRLNLEDQMYASETTLLAWMQRCYDEVYNWDGAYHPGAHCHRCPLSVACTARDAYMAGTVRDITAQDEHSSIKLAMLNLTCDDMPRRRAAGQYLHGILEAGKIIAERCDGLREVIKKHAQEKGDIPISDDKAWHISPTNRVRVNLSDAWGSLPEKLADDLLKSTWLSQSAVTTAAKRHDIDGKGLVKSLDTAGAVRVTKSESLRVCNLIPTPTKERSQS